MVDRFSKLNQKVAILLTLALFPTILVLGILNMGLHDPTEAKRLGLPVLQIPPGYLGQINKIIAIGLSFAVTIGGVFLIEALAVGWQKSSIRSLILPRKKSHWYDIIIYGAVKYGFYEKLGTFFTLGLTFVSIYFWASFGKHVLPESARITTGNYLGDVVVFYFVFTFFDYWNHRLFHFTSLWHLHRMHHSATELSILTASRNHPAAMALEPFIRNWPIALIGLSPQGVGLYNLVMTPYFHLIHSRTGWDLGWFGRWILISPRGHGIHHSDQMEHMNKNLSICPIWDRLFGTWYSGHTINTTFGLIDGDYPTNNLVKEWFLDMRAFWNDLVQTMKNRGIGLKPLTEPMAEPLINDSKI